MDSKTRFLNALSFKEIDRVPVIPQLTYAAAKWSNMKIDEALTDRKKQLKALVYAQETCGYDAIYAGWEGSFVLLSSALGSELQVFEDKPPNVQKPLINSKDDLEKLKTLNPQKDGRIPINLKLIQDLKKESQVPILSYLPAPFTLSGLFHGTDKLMLLIYMDMDFLKELVKHCLDLSYTFGKAKIDAGVDAITIADPTGSSDMISPKHFEQLSFPSLKELITKLKSHGVKVGLHICGNTRPILHLMVKTGADYIEVDQAVDLKEARIEAQKTCIMGNVGTSDLLSGSKESIIEFSENCIEKIGEKGYILSSGCEVPYGTPIENIQAMVETATKHQKA